MTSNQLADDNQILHPQVSDTLAQQKLRPEQRQERLRAIQAVAAAGPYDATWQSLARMHVPSWFADAKFGIFTHWGLYTVPEYRNEWYSRNMYISGYPEYEYHRATYGPQDTFGYKDFIPCFTAEQFDADAWLDLFQQSGARYYFPVSEHHDGFQMYQSDISVWNTVDMGPHRDIIGELREATIRHGMHFATSNHRAEHWWFMGHGREFTSDVCEPMQPGDFYWPAQPEPDNQDVHSEPMPAQEFLEDWLLRVCEIIDRYQPELLYFDWWVQHAAFKPYMQILAAYYYNRGVAWGKQVAICYKEDAMAWGSGIVDVERGGLPDATPYVWQTDTAIARNSWCYTRSLAYKSLSELVITLIDVVSKNGNLLLNVGPRADGSIADHDRKLLEGIGRWLDINGEAVYETRPWRLSQEGPTPMPSGSFSDQQPVQWTAQDWRFTSKDGVIYAICLHPMQHDAYGTHCADILTITSMHAYHHGQQPPFHGIIRGVVQLGAGPVPFERDADGLHIHVAQQAVQEDVQEVVQEDVPHIQKAGDVLPTVRVLPIAFAIRTD